MYRSAKPRCIFCTQATRHNGIDTTAHTDQQSGKERNHHGTGTDRPKCLRTGKAPHHRNIGHVEEHLKQIRQHQRQAEQQNILRQ